MIPVILVTDSFIFTCNSCKAKHLRYENTPPLEHEACCAESEFNTPEKCTEVSGGIPSWESLDYYK